MSRSQVDLSWEGRPRTFTLANAAGEVGKVLEERMKIFAQPPERFNDAREDSFALGNWIAGFLIEFAKVRGTARLGKGTLGVPLGQRIANGGIDKKFLTSRCYSQNVHDSISEILCLKGVEIIGIVGVCGSVG